MVSLSGMIILYVIGIIVGKRRQRVTPGAIMLLIALAIMQTVIVAIDMYTRKPPTP
jgi:hypothetical protein